MSYEKLMKNQNKLISLSKIVGYLMGDGWVTKIYLRYLNKDSFLINNFKINFKKTFGEVHFILGIVNSGTPFMQVQNKSIIEFLFSLCEDFKSENLQFPEFIEKYELKKMFIQSIFDDEGCVGQRVFKKTGKIKRNLEIASKSKKFLDEIRVILEKDFQIKCNKIISFSKKMNKKEFLTWKLSITGKENFIKFADKINFASPKKRKKLDIMINSYIRLI